MIAGLWLRPLWQRPSRALGTIAGVALGVASVVSTALASRAAVASLTSDVAALAGEAQLEVTRPGGVPLADLELLRAFASEVWIAPVVEGAALSLGGGASESRELVRLFGVDLLLDQELRTLTLTGERDESAARDALLHGRGAALSRSGAERLGVGVGDTLALVVQSRRVELEVAALFEPAHFSSAWERLVLLDVALAQELLGRTATVDRLELRPRNEGQLDLEEFAARLARALPAGYRVAPASARRDEGERLIRSLAFNLTALAGVSVLVGMVLVATTLATSIVERRTLLALLRSLGASRGQLALAVALEAALIGLAGGALGVWAGRAVAQRLAVDVHGSMATIAEDALLGAVELGPGWVAAGIALGVFTALVAALLPLREARRIPPLQALRGEMPSAASASLWTSSVAWLVFLLAAAWFCTRLPPWNGRAIWALVAALLLLATELVLAGPLLELLGRVPARWLGTRFGPPLRLAQAALSASRQRAAWAASAVGVAVALAVSMATLVGSFRSNVVDWTNATMRADLNLRPLPTDAGSSAGRVAPEVVELAEELFGAENLDPYHQTTATVNGLPISLGGAAFAVLAREGGVPFLDGRAAEEVFRDAHARGAAVVNEPFARNFGLARGELVELSTSGGRTLREIAGVYRDFSGHMGRVVLDLADYRALQPEEGPESVAIFLPEGADVERSRALLNAALAGRYWVEVLNNGEARAEVLRIFERTFAVTVALQLISCGVAALAVLLVLGALVRERVRDLAVVRVLGGSRGQLGTLVVSQALLLGVAGALGGLAVGLLVGWVLVSVVNVQSFGWSLRFAPPASILWNVLAVVPACFVAGLLPAWLSWRSDPQEALREPD